MHLLYTPQTQLLLSSYRAHTLCANTFSQLNKRLWPSCHSDVGGSRHDWGFYPRKALTSLIRKNFPIILQTRPAVICFIEPAEIISKGTMKR